MWYDAMYSTTAFCTCMIHVWHHWASYMCHERQEKHFLRAEWIGFKGQGRLRVGECCRWLCASEPRSRSCKDGVTGWRSWKLWQVTWQVDLHLARARMESLAALSPSTANRHCASQCLLVTRRSQSLILKVWIWSVWCIFWRACDTSTFEVCFPFRAFSLCAPDSASSGEMANNGPVGNPPPEMHKRQKPCFLCSFPLWFLYPIVIYSVDSLFSSIFYVLAFGIPAVYSGHPPVIRGMAPCFELPVEKLIILAMQHAQFVLPWPHTHTHTILTDQALSQQFSDQVTCR